MPDPDPLDVYEARAIEAAEVLDQYGHVADDASRTAQQVAHAARMLAELTAAQSREACARRAVQTAATAHADWPAARRAATGRAVLLPLLLPVAAGMALAAWTVALTILVLGLVAFILICVVGRSSHLAAQAGRSAESAAHQVGMFGIDLLRAIVAPLPRGTRTHERELRAACETASARWEDAAVALLQAERGMPYTLVLPLARLDEETAARMELGVAVIRGADRATT